MVKRRKYGDAWKDVQIDAEQNDAVFDRFFKRTSEPAILPSGQEDDEPSAGEEQKVESSAAQPARSVSQPSQKGTDRRSQSRATVRNLPSSAPALFPQDADVAARVSSIKQQFRLSKGEAAILRQLLQLAQGNKALECYAKIPQLADACDMTHRGCQFALKSLNARGFVTRIEDYDPVKRLGIKFRISLPL